MITAAKVSGVVGTTTKIMYHGTYTGSIVNNNDPLNLGRVTLKIPQVLGTATSNWAPPSGYSVAKIPPNGTKVHVQFEGGDVNHPIYIYGAANLTTIYPTGDTTGLTDYNNIVSVLSSGNPVVQLAPGRFYVNSMIEFPQAAVIRGSGRSGLGIFSQTTIQPTVAMDAVFASQGWLEGSNTVAQETATIQDLKVYGNNLATHGVVSQNYDALFSNLEIQNVTGDGLRFDVFSQSGSAQVTTSGVNNRVYSCTFQNCGRGFATNEANTGSPVYTDGFLDKCIVASVTGSAGVCIQRAAGWKISDNHLYGLTQHGFQLGQIYMTRIVNNYIETWGTTSTSGVWRAIDGVTIGQSDDGPGSVIAGNVLGQFTAPGNSSTNLEGISLFCDNSNTTNVTVTGNILCLEPSTGWATAHAFEYANGGSGSVFNIASTGNLATGHWSVAIAQVANGGTINITSGI
jgi:hypothetical protein